MTNVTCGLTAKKLGSAPCPTLVFEYGTTFLVLDRAQSRVQELAVILILIPTAFVS